MNSDNTKQLDELERLIHSLRTVSDLLLTNDGNDVTPGQVAGVLNAFLDGMDSCLNQIDRRPQHE